MIKKPKLSSSIFFLALVSIEDITSKPVKTGKYFLVLKTEVNINFSVKFLNSVLFKPWNVDGVDKVSNKCTLVMTLTKKNHTQFNIKLF